MQTILGQKKEQTQRFLSNGNRIPVTVVAVADNVVVGIKTPENDHYAAYQLGVGQKKNATKPLLGHAKKANLANAPILIREVKLLNDAPLPTLGEVLSLSNVFKSGDIVSVSGISKGKGWAGGVKRYHFKGGPRTHGQSDRERAPGSIGQTTTPGRVYKGKRMAGRMGSDKVTVKNLEVVAVNETAKTILIKGLIPGSVNSYVVITKIGEVKQKNYIPLHDMHLENTPEETNIETVSTQGDTPVAPEEAIIEPVIATEEKNEKEEENGKES